MKQSIENKPINKLYVAIQESRALWNKSWFLREGDAESNHPFEIHVQPSFIGTYELNELSKVADIYNVGISEEVKDAIVIRVALKEGV